MTNLEPTFDDPQDFDLERAKLARRRKIAEELISTEADAPRMLGNNVLNTGPMGGIAASIARGLGTYDQAKIDDQAKLLSANEAHIRSRILEGLGTKGTKQQVYDPVANPGTGPLVNGEVPLTPDEEQARRFKLYGEGMNVPSLRKTLEAQLGAELKQPLVEDMLDTKLANASALQDVKANAMLRGIDARIQGQKELRAMPTIHITQGGGRGGVKAPPGYRYNEDGTALEFIPGGPKDPSTKSPAADKPLNENQGNALLYGTRAAQAHNVLDSVGANYSPIKIDMARGAEKLPGGRQAANAFVLGEQEQKVDQAQRNFINAIMRRESGAAIAPSEFDNARKQYFPEQSDSDAVKAQKKANRELVIQGLGQIAGPMGEKAVKAEQANKPKSDTLTPAEQAELDQLRTKHGRK